MNKGPLMIDDHGQVDYQRQDWSVTTGGSFKFVKIVAPLTWLTRKAEKFEWTEKRENNFQELKQRLVTAPMMALPDGKGDFVKCSDASHKGLGCVLMEHGKVIAYMSRQLR